MPTTIGPIAVNASADDASEAATVVSITANPLANCENAGIWNAWIFRGINIPAGVTVTAAYLTVNFTSTSLDEPDVTIYGLDTTTPAAFTTDASNISGRTRTTASVNWAVANAGSDDINTSDLSTIVQELVNSYAPYSSGVMGFCWTSRANDTGRDTSVTSYDGDTGICARLTITFTGPSPSVSPSVSRSLSPSFSESPSVSVSESPSLSPSSSESVSESPSISVSVSPSESLSLSPSFSESPSVSVSESPSLSPSSSESLSESPSASPSEVVESRSVSPSTSPSGSESPSSSVSPSASPSTAAPWLEGWDYRREITIKNSVASELTNFQVPIDINFVDDVAAGKAKADLTDLRVTDDDGATLLDFFREYTGNNLGNLNNWWRWEENPLIPCSAATAWDDNWIHPYSIIDLSGTLRMYYGGASGSNVPDQVGIATSNDGMTWTKDGNNPIFSPDTAGAWDDTAVEHFCVLKEDANWYAWYAGHGGDDVWKVGYATSSDGISWTRYGSNPVMEGTAATWDSGFVIPSQVWKESSTYYMLYFGGTSTIDSTTWEIGLATSSDRTTWTKEATNPVLEGVDDSWEDAVLDCHAVKIGSTYYMFYQGNTASQQDSRIGLATSTDLTTWTKSDDNPIEGGGVWDAKWNEGPLVYQVGNTWMLYYMGNSTSDMTSDKAVGVMRFKPTRLWVEVPTIPASGEAIVFVYYGKSDAVDDSSGADTFVFFEDFANFDAWNNAGSFTTGTDRGEANAEKTGNNTDTTYFLYTDNPISAPCIVEVRARVQEDWFDEYSWHFRLDLTDSGGALANALEFGHYKDASIANRWYFRRYASSSNTHTSTLDLDIEANAWTKLALHVPATGTCTAKFHEGTRALTIAADVPDSTPYIQLTTGRASFSSDYTTNFDKVWVRAYAATEPTYSVDNEEEGPSASVSPSVSVSESPSQSPSSSESLSLSPSSSESPSLSPSSSESLSLSPSWSESPSSSESLSESPSSSESPSVSVSTSPSESISTSPSLSQSYSVSPSASPSTVAGSASVSPSVSPSFEITGTVTWGHDTGVTEDNIRDFAGNWTGTGSISGSGDAETICLEEGQYMESEIVSTGDQYVELFQNLYNGSGDDVLMYYRTGATAAATFGATWIAYTGVFQSSGFVQVRLESTIGFPLEVSGSGRYLVTSSGSPFLLLSDSPQGMMVTRSTADMDTYFSARAGQGFNACQVHIVAGTTFGGGSNTDYETYDDITPFTTQGDISTPRESYFARLDTLVDTAASYGIVVFLNATEHIDAGDLWETNGNTKCYNWGAYLGNRYKDKPNIVWMIGNDFQDWSTDAGKVAADINVINGIQSADSNHTLFTMWLDYYHSAARDSTDFNAECTLDNAYTYYVAYDKVGEEYALSPAKPVFLIESYYQDYTTLSLTGTSFIVRKQNYWSMLAGACGVTAMNVNWPLGAGWDTELTTKECFTEIVYLKNLFEAYSWHLLIPDTGNDILTAGYGTKRTGTVQPDTDDYANCAYLADGSLAIIYMPENMTMTVDMSQFSGTVTCRWYDPTNGTYTADAASPHTNSGTHDFSRATANSAGASDWVLVLEVA